MIFKDLSNPDHFVILEFLETASATALCSKPLNLSFELKTAKFFSLATSNRTRGNGLKLCLRQFRFDIKMNFFTERVVTHWKRLLRKVVESLSPEGFKDCLDMTLQAMVFSKRLDSNNLGSLFQP